MTAQAATAPLGVRELAYVACMARVPSRAAWSGARGQVAAQFYPDGFEWVERAPLPLSLGFSSKLVRLLWLWVWLRSFLNNVVYKLVLRACYVTNTT